jgi:hypothetical protein
MWQDLSDSLAAATKALIVILPDIAWCLSACYLTSCLLGHLYPIRYRMGAGLPLASFGSLIGIFMGASKEPLIQSLFPTFVTIAAGYLAYLFQRDSIKRFIRLYAPSIVAMILSILFSTFYHKYLSS